MGTVPLTSLGTIPFNLQIQCFFLPLMEPSCLYKGRGMTVWEEVHLRRRLRRDASPPGGVLPRVGSARGGDAPRPAKIVRLGPLVAASAIGGRQVPNITSHRGSLHDDQQPDEGGVIHKLWSDISAELDKHKDQHVLHLADLVDVGTR